jgi:DNA-directed RNA polymerase subunit RPC12/RpoP
MADCEEGRGGLKEIECEECGERRLVDMRNEEESFRNKNKKFFKLLQAYFLSHPLATLPYIIQNALLRTNANSNRIGTPST